MVTRHVRSQVALALAAVLVLLSGVTARAQGEAVATDDEAVEATAESSAEAEARARFEAGRIAFDAGRYEAALEDFRRAYDLSGRAALLYNVGQSADRLRRDREAVEAFEAFLAAQPESAEAPAVRARLAVLREAIAERERAEAEAARPEPSPPPPPPPSRAGPWGLGLAGGALVIAGAGLFGAGLRQRNEIEGLQVPTPWSELEPQVDRVPVLTGVGLGALSLGLALAGVAILWRVLQADDVSVAIGPDRLRLRVSF